MTEPITIKMKMANPEQTTALLTNALKAHYWHNEDIDTAIPEMVRAINLALVHAGCVIIQLDNE